VRNKASKLIDQSSKVRTSEFVGFLSTSPSLPSSSQLLLFQQENGLKIQTKQDNTKRRIKPQKKNQKMKSTPLVFSTSSCEERYKGFIKLLRNDYGGKPLFVLEPPPKTNCKPWRNECGIPPDCGRRASPWTNWGVPSVGRERMRIMTLVQRVTERCWRPVGRI
jgi:hypothetical protein